MPICGADSVCDDLPGGIVILGGVDIVIVLLLFAIIVVVSEVVSLLDDVSLTLVSAVAVEEDGAFSVASEPFIFGVGLLISIVSNQMTRCLRYNSTASVKDYSANKLIDID